MIAAEKPPLGEAYLEHFGVKGMKWGQRKAKELSKPPSTAKKVAARVGAVLLALGSVAFVTGIIVKTGNYPSKPTKLTTRHIAKGKSAVSKVQSHSEWKRDVNSVLKDMEQANADQDRWMRSLGLGAAVNNRS